MLQLHPQPRLHPNGDLMSDPTHALPTDAVFSLRARAVVALAGLVALLVSLSSRQYASAVAWGVFSLLFSVAFPALARRPGDRAMRLLVGSLTIGLIAAALWRLAEVGRRLAE